METIIKKQPIKKVIEDIALDISWAKISQKYFNKSATWMYDKLNESSKTDNTGFTDSEKDDFKNALFDLADRIRKTAEKI